MTEQTFFFTAIFTKALGIIAAVIFSVGCIVGLWHDWQEERECRRQLRAAAARFAAHERFREDMRLRDHRR